MAYHIENPLGNVYKLYVKHHKHVSDHMEFLVINQ